ncbi:zinc finger, CCHC-type containing protein [Tanacetum coccineum]
MGDENPIRTLGDYSKPSHKGYMNTIKLLIGNNMAPLRSDIIRLVQNGCSFHGLRERMCLHLFQFSLHDQASNWLERLPAGSISTWEDLTTRFLDQFFPPGRTAKLRNDILMFQQHHGEYLSEAWTRFKDLLQKVPHHGIDLWLQVQIFYDHVNPVTRRTIDQSAGGKLRDLKVEKSWALLEDLTLCDNEMVSMTLSIAWKTTNKPLLNTHPCVPMKWEVRAISHDEKEKLRKKGIKSPSKLLSPKYLFPASIKELNKILSSPKRVYFINSVVILSTDRDTEEEDDSSTNACDLNLSGMVKGKEEVKEKGKEEDEM